MSVVAEAATSSLFPLFDMGQYFKAVNTDKKEFVCPWCIGGGAKLWEWAANPKGSIFTLLLRKSDKTGGGDYGTATRYINVSGLDSGADIAQIIRDTNIEGDRFIAAPTDSIVGRWAGDRVVLVGDYDSSQLWDELDEYRNISAELVDEWNRFIELPERKLEFNPDCGCGQGERN